MPAAALHLLLVEDDDVQAMIVERALQGGGHPCVVRRARDGEEALAALRAAGEGGPRIDLVILDLRLPRITGHEVLKEAKADPRLRRTPIVVLSTSESTRDIREAYDLHANSFLNKPLEFDEFRAMLTDAKNYWGRWNQLPEG